MRRRIIVMGLAVPMCVALTSMTFAAQVPAKAKPAAKAAKKFDQKAVLNKFWNGPDSAVVGSASGIKVTKGELTKALWDLNAPSALQDLLNQKMIEQTAKKAGVSVTPAEVQAKITEALSRTRSASVDQLLNQYRITYARFISTIRLSALAEKIASKDVAVTDAEYAEFIKARHVLVVFPQDITDQAKKEEAAKQKIDAIALRLKNGEDFAKVAKEASEDPGSAQNGGDLGWFSKGRMVPEFEKAAFELKSGQISEPIKTEYGYHIIKAEALGRDASAQDKASLKKMILEKKLPPAMQSVFNTMQTNAKIENLLMPPPEKAPVAPASMRAPRPAPRPTPQPAPKPAEAAPSDKPDAPPPTP